MAVESMEDANSVAQEPATNNQRKIKKQEEARKHLMLSESSRMENQVHIVFFSMDKNVYPFLNDLDEESVKQLNELLGEKKKWIDQTKNPALLCQFLPLFRRNK
jgi:hypothetical protein